MPTHRLLPADVNVNPEPLFTLPPTYNSPVDDTENPVPICAPPVADRLPVCVHFAKLQTFWGYTESFPQLLSSDTGIEPLAILPPPPHQRHPGVMLMR